MSFMVPFLASELVEQIIAFVPPHPATKVLKSLRVRQNYNNPEWDKRGLHLAIDEYKLFEMNKVIGWIDHYLENHQGSF